MTNRDIDIYSYVNTIVIDRTENRDKRSHSTSKESKDDVSPPDDSTMSSNTDSNSVSLIRSSSGSVVRSLASTISLKKAFKRAGAIPYVEKGGKRYYCMGVDRSGELTDFGGQVELRENYFTTALRELKEETMGIFDYCDPSLMKMIRSNAIAIHDEKKTIILFIKVEVDNLDKIVEEYNQRVILENNPENIKIAWISEDIFTKLYSVKSRYVDENGVIYPRIYSRIADILNLIGLNDPLGLGQ